MVVGSRPKWSWAHDQNGCGLTTKMVVVSRPRWSWADDPGRRGLRPDLSIRVCCTESGTFGPLGREPKWSWAHDQNGRGLTTKMVVGSRPTNRPSAHDQDGRGLTSHSRETSEARFEYTPMQYATADRWPVAGAHHCDQEGLTILTRMVVSPRPRWSWAHDQDQDGRGLTTNKQTVGSRPRWSWADFTFERDVRGQI